MKKIIDTIDYNYMTKFEAFPYQAEAYKTLRDLDYAAIFHEQGLGKTKIAIDLLLYWLEYRDIDTVLIITKKQLVKNWVDEIGNHIHIKPQTLNTNKKDNFIILNSASKIVITNFETLMTDNLRIKLFLECRNVACIIDESTKLKNPDSKITKTYFEVAELFKIKVIMSGTPIANRPFDIWSQIYFLDKGKSLGKNFEDFKSKTNLSNDLQYDIDKKERFETVVSEIYNKISKFTVRETKSSGIVELPNKVYKNIYVDFSEEQRKIYYRLLDELITIYKKNNSTSVETEENSLKRLLRLMQICSNPRLINIDYQEISGKEKKLESIVNGIIDRNEMCIVWSSFIENVDYFAKKFSDIGTCKIHGKMSIDDRNKSVDLFKNKKAKLLFATPQAAKEGLTLTVANNVIFYDRGFNLDDYLQAQDRIHRISQKKTCYVYNLMISESVDIWIDKLIEAKHNAALLAQGDINLKQYKDIADYSYNDIVHEILNREGDAYGK
jgi:SNF2 family DNA or RNA helicase